jgi:hypothetical protein
LRKDPRTAKVKIVVMAKDVEKAKEHFGESINAVIAGPLTGKSLGDAVNEALKDVPVEYRNARAEQVAANASHSLAVMAEAHSPIQGALAALAGQLDRGDAVALPAAKALGAGGTARQVPSLLTALQGGGSLELKIACADAIGDIMARSGESPAEAVQGLAAVLHSDADLKLRTACANALGKAKLADSEKAKLLDSLRKIGG